MSLRNVGAIWRDLVRTRLRILELSWAAQDGHDDAVGSFPTWRALHQRTRQLRAEVRRQRPHLSRAFVEDCVRYWYGLWRDHGFGARAFLEYVEDFDGEFLAHKHEGSLRVWRARHEAHRAALRERRRERRAFMLGERIEFAPADAATQAQVEQ